MFFAAAIEALHFSTASVAMKDAIFVLWGVLGAAALLIGAARTAPKRRSPWLLLAGGQLMFATGNGVYTYYEVVQERLAPFPSAAEPFFLCAYGLTTAALMALPNRKRVTGTGVDSAVMSAAAGLGAWIFVSASRDVGGLITNGFTLGYTAVNIFLLVALVAVIGLRADGGATLWRFAPYRFLAAGIVINAIASCAYAAAALNGTYRTGHPIDLGWHAFSILVIAAAMHPALAQVSDTRMERKMVLTGGHALLYGGALLAGPVSIVVTAQSVFTMTDVIIVGAANLVLVALVVKRLSVLLRELNVKVVDLQNREDDLLQVMNEREDLRERVAHLQKLEAIGTLAGGVAHDFNNILAVISGYAGFLEESGTPEQRSDAREIRKAADRGTKIVRQLLTFSRRDVAAQRVINAADCIDEAAEFLRCSAGPDACIEIDVSAAQDADVLIDPSHLQEAVTNLVTNARDALEQGGGIAVEVATVQVDVAVALLDRSLPPGRYVRISVADSGVGIEEDQLRRIFEPFFTTKEVGKGTGLGLSSVYALIDSAGGFIDVTSKPGEGTTFCLYLPNLKRESGSERLQLMNFHGGKALVVDDNPAVSAVVARLLSDRGIEVVVESSPPEAIRRLSQSQFDLLITDVVMPVIGGPELALRAAALIPGIAVILMTGYGKDLVDQAGDLGDHVPCLKKPFDEHELEAALARAFGRSVCPAALPAGVN